MTTNFIERQYYKEKLKELEYIDEIIMNLVRLQRLYSSNDKKFNVIETALPYWINNQEKVNGELNDLKGYGTYKQKT
jgi:hypothetical protein